MVQAATVKMITEEQGQYIDVDGLRTWYMKVGEGHPFVLIHGGAPGACTTVSWSPIVDKFAASGFAVYAYDVPGYGFTDNPTDFSLDYRAAHGIAFVKKLGLDQGRFHLMGNSQGAYVAARIALEVPGADKLVVEDGGTIAPPGSPETQEISRKHGEKLRSYTPSSIESARTLLSGTLWKTPSEELVQARFQMSSGRLYEAQQRRSEAPRPQPIYDELHRLPGKTLIAWGANDRGDPVEHALLLLQKVAGSEVHLFDQACHWPQWDQTERFHQVVTNFLQSAD